MERQQVWPIVGGALMALGSFLPWARAGFISLAGTDGDGVFTLIGGVIIVALTLAKKQSRAVGVIVMLIAVGGGLIAYNVFDNLDSDSIGTGLYVAGLGAFIAAVASIQLWQTPAAQPQ